MDQSEGTASKCQHEILEDAVKHNDIAFLKAALDNGADVNRRNADGDTLLHIAIDNDANYECLETLLEKGAGASIINKMGLKPLHMINSDSFGTFMNLYKLNKYFDSKEYHGNTLLHFLMINGADKETMHQILLNSSSLEIDMNATNDEGMTMLHLAAERILLGEENLDMILSHFDELNVLQKDVRGNTFLHRYLKVFGDADELEFLNNVLDGKYHCCSREVLKKLLESKNNLLETPFHLYIEHGGLYKDIELCEKFHKAGANFNTCNIKEETVLHNLDRCKGNENHVIEFIVKNGVDINKKNIFLETPVFHINDVNVMKLFLDNGANINTQNKVGKNVLMAKLLEDDLQAEVIELLLEQGANVNTTDIHGNTCLHYAAWRNVDKEVVQILRMSGGKIRKNKVGELPCSVAEKMLHVDLISELCACQPGIHNILKCHKRTVVKAETLQQDGILKAGTLIKQTDTLEVDELLRLPYIGAVEFSGEAGELKQAVTKVVADICLAIGERDEVLKNSVLQSGSVGEKTKVGIPDEFDFICLIDFVSRVCELDQEKSQNDAGYAYVRLKEEYRAEHGPDGYDANFYLESDSIYLRFVTALKEVLQTPTIYTHPNIVFGLEECKEGPMVPNCKFSLRWTGAEFMDVTVDVDLVPACRIPAWWPSCAKLDTIAGDTEKLQSEGALLLLQMTVDENYDPEAKLRVSSQNAEKVHMSALPQVARDAYMVSKIICGNRLCPKVQLSEEPSYLKTFLTSYMLKNCLFHVFHEIYTEENIEAHDLSNLKLHEIVVRIFKKLLCFAESENLPAFVFPWQNVFTFQDGPAAEDHLFLNQINPRSCMCRRIYTKLILNMLGEEFDFQGCDLQKATEYA